MASHPLSTGPIRIQAAPGHRRLATLAQWTVVALLVALGWAAVRLLGLVWADRGDPETGRAMWLFVGGVALAGSTLGYLVVLLQDLVKLTIEVSDKGITVVRLLQPFTAGWDEVQEIGLVSGRGHLTLRTARGRLTATERLLGAASFAALVGALRARAGSAVREWTPWAAARRQLLLFVGPALGLAWLVFLAKGVWRRPPADGVRRR